MAKAWLRQYVDVRVTFAQGASLDPQRVKPVQGGGSCDMSNVVQRNSASKAAREGTEQLL